MNKQGSDFTMITIDPNSIVPDALEMAFHLKEYTFIQSEASKQGFKATDEYRKTYNGFYRVRQRSNAWYNRYYQLLEEQKVTQRSFIDLLEILYPLGKKLEVSFVSKLIATAEPENPLWGQYVIKYLGYKNTWEKLKTANLNTRIEMANKIYLEIQNWYSEFIQSENGKECIATFDTALPKYKDILTDVKKVDFILWSKRG